MLRSVAGVLMQGEWGDLTGATPENRRLAMFAVSVPLAILCPVAAGVRSEEHTSELQSLMRISYAVFCLKKKRQKTNTIRYQSHNKYLQTTLTIQSDTNSIE